MDVRLSPEQTALRDSVAQAVGRLGPKTVQDLDDSERQAKLGAAIAAAGWRELRAPADDGTPWASGVEAAIVALELARGLADGAFFGPVLAAELRRLASAPASSRPETVAFTVDLSSLGSALAVDTIGAETALVLLANGALAEVEIPDGRVLADLTRPSSPLPPIERTGVDTGIGPLSTEAATRWRALGLALSCADLVGTMWGALKLARDYAAERRQYGVPIGSFQAVQHLLADAHVAAEGSWSMTLHASWAVDALPPAEALLAAATAKAYCARAARSVCEAAIQVHGGIGNTWECLAHVYLRRALLSADLLGGVGPSLGLVLAHHGLGSVDGLR